MPDTITVRNESTYVLAPEGQHRAVCVDTIDLGNKIESYQGGPEKLSHKIALVWQIGDSNPETGKRFEVSQEYTLSFGEKSALRKLLSAWRGKSYTNDEAKKGVPVHKLVGVNCLLQIEHRTSGSGKTYARVLTATPLPKEMPKIEIYEYARWEGWVRRKADYAEGAQRWADKHEYETDDEYGGQHPDDDNDPLPF